MNLGATMATACETCGGALEPGMDVPPCLCELGALEPAPGVPEAEGGTETEARALKCPGCGAFLETGARRCGYCGIELASVRCWRCFELGFAGSSHCRRCGAALGLEGDAGPTGHRCPTCEAGELHLIDVGEHRIEECPSCTGVMVDHETLESLTRRREAEAGVRAIGSKRVELKVEEVRYRKCPKCDRVMTRKNFGRRSGVIVDVCADHGLWFDPHELTAVLEFVATGGLEESRQRDIDDAKAELSRRRLEALTQQHKSSNLYSHQTTAASSGALLSALSAFDW